MVDTTLRDGEQAPGVVFTQSEKIAIAAALSEAGIDEIEVGIPAMGGQARQDIQKISRLNLPVICTSWCRAVKKDIEQAAQCNTPGIHISFPASSILLKTVDKDETWVLKTLESLVTESLKYFDQVSVGAQDASRTCENFLRRFALHARDAGAKRLRLADTVGIMTPSGTFKLIDYVTGHAPGIELEFHGHNDLGMATANAVTAVEAGARSLSVTVNGLGERAGNASLEETAVALFEIGRFKSRIQTKNLARLCNLVASASGFPIPAAKPVTGKNVFRHESGIHCAALIRDISSYQLFAPETVGKNNIEWVIGYHSGSKAICHALKKQGIDINREVAEKLLVTIRKISYETKSFITPAQLVQIYKKSTAGKV